MPNPFDEFDSDAGSGLASAATANPEGSPDLDTPGLTARNLPPLSPIQSSEIKPKSDQSMALRSVESVTPSKNPFDEFDANPFDQFDKSAPSPNDIHYPGESSTINPFDKFDARPTLKEPAPLQGKVDPGIIKYNPFAYLIPGGPERVQSAINSANQAGFDALGNAVEWGGGLLSLFDSSSDQYADPNSNPYLQAGQKIKQYAANFITDPKFSGTNAIGNLAGNILPATAAGPLAPLAGATMLGSSVSDEALARGADVPTASLLSLPAAALGVVSPVSRLLKPASGVASATWGQLFKNAAIGAGVAGGKNLLEMSGINAVTNEMVNAVSPPNQQETQLSLLSRSILDALPMAFAGAALHIPEQGISEYNVGQIAREQGQLKADLIGNTTQFYQNLADNNDLTPHQKVAASTEYCYVAIVPLR